MRRAFIFAMLALTILSSPTFAEDPNAISVGVPIENRKAVRAEEPGDRVHSDLAMQGTLIDAAARATVILADDYRIGAGDVLTLCVRGKVDLHYGNATDPRVVTPGVPSQSPDTYEVKSDGNVILPILGPVQAAGRTIEELRTTVTEKLSAYYKQFTVDLSVAKPGLVKIWVSGQVMNPGPQAVPSTATVLEALLRAGIQPTGSTRLVKLTRDGKASVIDVYGIISRGDIGANVTLQSGDQIFVPPVTNWITMTGEVCRPGKFEMVSPGQSDGGECRISDVVSLSLGMLPTAAASHVVIERSNPGGDVSVLHCDLTAKDDPALKPGDKIIIPSVSEYQPTIRLVGEFKGEGVYQRMAAGTVLNKSGVYKLAQGETVGDIITRTGGTTPQADLKQAKIERRANGTLETIPVDLDRLLVRSDKTADVALESGDTVILPALQEKVYVFGQVGKPGGFSYEPDRRTLDYLAYAGGPTGRAKSRMILVRNNRDKSETMKLDLSSGMNGNQKDNPIVQPGDIIYVPEGIVTDWRDLTQIITTVRLFGLL